MRTAEAGLSGACALLVGLWRFDDEVRRPRESQEIRISADQDIGLSTLSQVQKWLVAWIAADGWAMFRNLDQLAEWNIVGAELIANIGL